jgi:serine/threonine protein kinase/WD40 repeat protein
MKHPSPDQLAAFGLGKLIGPSADTVVAHLETCVDCRRAVASLPADSFVGRIQVADAGSTPSAVPPELANHPDYRIVRELGRGGMGVVYLARNTIMDRDEVLKVAHGALLEKPGASNRFLQEIRSAAQLMHVNVVPAYSALRLGDLLVFAMEYVPGDDLAKIVRKQGALPVVAACNYAAQVALGLQHAYEKGMVHRDIKPGNLILSRDGKKPVVKILDFGLAKMTSEVGFGADLTGSNKMMGTPDYVAPEQILDAAKADIRADIYSLGCTLYYLLSGSPPFAGGSLYEVLHAHSTATARPLNLVRPEVSIELAAVVAKMLAKDPGKRYQTPGEVAKELQPFTKPGAVPTSAAAPVRPLPGRISDARPGKSAKTQGPVDAPKLPRGKADKPSPFAFATKTMFGESPTKPTSKRSAQVQVGRPLWYGLAIALAIGFVGLAVVASGVLRVTPGDVDFRVDVDRVDVDRVTKKAPKIVEQSPNPKPPEPLLVIAGDETPVFAVSFNRDAKYVIAGFKDGKSRVFETSTGRADLMYVGRLGPVRCISCSDAGNFVITADRGDSIEVWHRDGKEIHLLPGKAKGVVCAAISRNGKQVVCSFSDKRLSVRDVESGKERVLLTMDSIAPVRALSFNGDGTWIMGRAFKTAYIWEAATGRTLQTFNGHVSFVNAVSVSEDGKLLVTGSLDKSIKVWDTATGNEKLHIDNGAPVLSAAITRDGKWIVSGGQDDKAVKVWNALTGRRVATLNGHSSGISCVSISRDDKKIVSGGFDGGVRTWNLDAVVTQAQLHQDLAPPPAQLAPIPFPKKTPKFEPLFNGKDLSGWNTGPQPKGTWRVEEGVLVWNSDEWSFLWTDRDDFADFHLRVEMRISNAGYAHLLVRDLFVAGAPDSRNGYHIVINNTNENPKKTGTLETVGVVLNQINASQIADNRWFLLEVIAQKDRVVIKVDGRTMTNYVDSQSRFARGRITLWPLTLRNPPGRIEFRKIEIKELP